MKHHIDIVINISDKHRVTSIPELYERISGNDEVKVLQQFMMAFTRILRDIHQRELRELQQIEVNDDIPF